MSNIKIGLIGAAGRMGKEIAQVIEANPGCELFYPVNRNEIWNPEKAASVDVWIDFSSPEALKDVLEKAALNNTPVVCGTTGLTLEHKELLAQYSNKIPLLWSSNMSLGVAVLNEAIKSLAAVSHFDFQIEEIHHNKKKDRPSGTAITLQENLKNTVKKDLPEPLAIRGGGVFGIHKVYSMSDEEILVFEHSALNRTVFAKGAVKAAEWLVNQEKGLYHMRDVLFGNKA
ncbi:MAG: 4-hydroxy-tetrahydrodipicolinate reductase [Pseudobdellovibrionaceae bacterium]